MSGSHRRRRASRPNTNQAFFTLDVYLGRCLFVPGLLRRYTRSPGRPGTQRLAHRMQTLSVLPPSRCDL